MLDEKKKLCRKGKPPFSSEIPLPMVGGLVEGQPVLRIAYNSTVFGKKSGNGDWQDVTSVSGSLGIGYRTEKSPQGPPTTCT
jgi:hypothetical protein